MKLYITDLAAYNSGFLIGQWVDMDITEEELTETIQSILKKGAEACEEDEHEEYFITDYEQDYDLFSIGEYSNPYRLREQYEEVAHLDEDDLKKISYLCENVNLDFEDAIQRYNEVVIYESKTLEEIVEEHLEQTVDFSVIPDIIAQNINYESIARDWDISGEYEDIEGDIYYFVN